jgi:hypothetical protein
MLLTAKENIMIGEWPARATIAHAVVRSCRTFEKRCTILTQYDGELV